MDSEYSGIELHSEGFGRDGHMAVNVKFYGRVNLSGELEQFGEQAYNATLESFWEQATE